MSGDCRGTESLYSHVAICVDPEKNLAIEAMALERDSSHRYSSRLKGLMMSFGL